jgi:hypothetical protein
MSAFEVAFRPVLLNALNVVNEMPAPEDANLGKLADRLMEIMFSRNTDSVVVPTTAEPVKEKKPRKSKKTEVAEPSAETAPEVPAEPVKEKKPRKSKKAEETPLPASDAEAEKPKKEKKPKKEGVNIEKLTPTQLKLLKPIADELKAEIDKAKFIEYLNNLAADVYTAKPIYEHFRDLVAPAVAAEPEERESIVVDFNGKTYYVTPEDKKVWEETDDGVHKFVGHVGMAAFADMKVPEL